MSWNSTYYKEHAKAQEKGALEIIETFGLQRDEWILDIGCGDGKITRAMAEKAFEGQVVGIDFSREMIALAAEDHTLAHLRFECQGAEAFTFEEKFNRVVSFHALHWVRDHAKILENVKAVLRPGGSMHFVMIAGVDPRIEEIFQKEPWKSHIQNIEERFFPITKEDYHRLLKEKNFIEDRVEHLGFSYRFRDVDHLTQYFMTWLPYATGFTHEKAELMAREMAENISLSESKSVDIDLVTWTLIVEAHSKQGEI